MKKTAKKPGLKLATTSEERKRKQYQEALEARSAAQYSIRETEAKLNYYKNKASEAQTRIGVLEYLFSNLRMSEPIIEQFIMDSIEGENDQVKSLNEESKGYRDALSDYRKSYTKAEKTITSIIENGPDMQDGFDFDDDDYPDSKSRSAGR